MLCGQPTMTLRSESIRLLIPLLFIVYCFTGVLVIRSNYGADSSQRQQSAVSDIKEKLNEVGHLLSRYRTRPISSRTTQMGELNYQEEMLLSKERIDPYRHRWLILERDFCTRRYKNLFVLIVVHTAVSHFKHRQAIREMWGDTKLFERFKTAVVFALGDSTNDTLREMVRKESIRYRDIIQQNFVDAYRLLVLKGLMWIRFVAEYCPQVPFILKIDDDIAFNYFGLVQYLTLKYRSKHFEAKPHTVTCLMWYTMKVMHENNSKWYVSELDYPHSTFSPYCSGSAFILSGDLIRPMLKESKTSRFLWVDDFFISGYLADKANATHESIPSLYELNGQRSEEALTARNVLFGVSPNIDHRKRIWKRLLEQYEIDSLDKVISTTPLTSSHSP